MRTTRSEVIAGQDVEAEFGHGRSPAVIVLWHGRLLACAYRYRGRQIGTLISHNRDGDHVAGMIRRWGFEVVRGSSSRGGSAAARELARILRQGRSVALTPDGPRGPRQKMKPGPVRAALQARVPLVPVSAGASRARYFGRWDRFMVPEPFAWCPFAFGEPIFVQPDAGEVEVRETAHRVELSLNHLTRVVDEAAGVHR